MTTKTGRVAKLSVGGVEASIFGHVYGSVREGRYYAEIRINVPGDGDYTEIRLALAPGHFASEELARAWCDKQIERAACMVIK